MKRFTLSLAVIFNWLMLIGVASAQAPAGEGSPPPSPLLSDTLFMAKAAPFFIALGIIFGLFQARAAILTGRGDAIIGEKVRRHDLSTVISHWSNAVGVILALVTGAIVLRWVDYSPDLRGLFILHYIGSALILFGVFAHLARHGVSGGTGLIPKSFGVIRDLIGEMFEYAGVFGPKEAVLRIPWPKGIRQPIAKYVRALLGYKGTQTDKYLSTEKILSYPVWAILMAVIVITGFIKLLKYVYVLPGSLITSATALHDLATVAIGIMLIFHLLPLLIVPANWPLLGSMFKTTVPKKYVEERHPVWHKRLSQAPEQARVEPSVSPEHAAPQTADA